MKIRFISFVLLLVLLFSILQSSILSVSSADTSHTVNATTAANRTDSLVEGLEGKYFTTTQSSCGNNQCDKCKNSNVISKSWLKNIMGLVPDSVNLLPEHYYSSSGYVSSTAWSCAGFANYCLWYIYAQKSSDNVRMSQIYVGKFNKSNMDSSGVRKGDIIRVDNHHSFVYISHNSSGVTVLDSNWSSSKHNLVQKHVIGWNWRSGTTMAITRGKNWSAESNYTLSIKYDANSGIISGSEVKYNKYKVSSSAGVNMRKGAGTDYSVIDTIPQNSTFVVTSTKTADGYTWGKTTYDGNTGWCVISEDWVTKVGTQPATTYYLDSSGLVYVSSTGEIKVQKMIDGEDYPDGLYNCSTFGISRAGYTFKGWGTTSSGGTIYSQSEAMTAKKLYSSISGGDKTIILYAIWEPISFTIQYNSNGGSGTMANTSAKYKEDFTLSANKFTRTGYTFNGWNVYRSSDKTWYCSGDGWKTSSEINSNNYTKRVYSDSYSGTLNDPWMNSSKTKDTITFYAIWTVNTLSVYYNANGGSIDSDTYKLSNNLVYNKSDSSKYIQKWTYNNKKTNGLANASTFGLYKEGYTFKGWGTTASGGTILDQNNTDLLPTDINSNIKNGSCTKTLYAIWEKTPVTLTGINVNTLPDKIVYYVGEDFNSNGLELNLIYSDGTVNKITDGFEISGYSSESEGEKTVNVSYGGKSTSFVVNVITIKVGDVNNDGVVNVMDATELQKHIAGTTTLDDEALLRGDVNSDGAINVNDATLIQKYSASLITEF